MNITILGCGRWGTFLAWYLNKIGHNVMLWGRKTSLKLTQLQQFRANEYVFLPQSIMLVDSLSTALSFGQYIIIAITGHNLRELLNNISPSQCMNKIVILCMKGIEPDTGYRFSEIAYEYLGDDIPIAVWLGPAQPYYIYQGGSTCMLVDSLHCDIKEKLAIEFNSDLIKIIIGHDMVGNEIGAAAKNIMGIAGGILDGLNLCGLKGLLMTRGTWEIAQLIKAMGGNMLSAYGICCLGDYEASMFSKESNSRNFGECLVRKECFGKYTPGKHSSQPMSILANKYNVKMPIVSAINDIIFERIEPQNFVQILLPENIYSSFCE